MFRLRHSKTLRALAILLMVTGLLAPFAAPAAPLLDDGICHVPDSNHDQPAHAQHDGCCVLCHAPALAAAGGAVLPLPGETVTLVAAIPAATAPAPQPAPAFYASRAPPIRS